MRPFLLIRYVGPNAAPMVRESDATWDWIDVGWLPGARVSRDADETVCIESPHKLAAVASWFRASGLFLHHAYALVDDDVEPFGCTWSNIFTAFAATGCRIGHPSIEPHPDDPRPGDMQRRIDGARWHRTTHADTMAPLFTVHGLSEHVDSFALEIGGEAPARWAFVEASRGGIAHLDATPVRHMRPPMTDAVREARRRAIDPDGAKAAFWARPEIRAEMLHEAKILEVHT